MTGDGDRVICNLGCEEELGETKRLALHWWPLVTECG